MRDRLLISGTEGFNTLLVMSQLDLEHRARAALCLEAA